jgi:hypothetical protein
VTWLAFLGTVEAIRGRPQASRAAFAAALEVAMPVDAFLRDFVLFHRASTEFYLLDEARARVSLAQLLAGPPPERGLHRRLHAGGQALAAAICSQAPAPLTEVPGGDLCDLAAEVDSTLDDLEALELLGWQALGDGRPQDAIRIGSTRRLIDAGGPGWRARTPAALAYEAMGQPDSAAAVYDGLVRAPFGAINHVQSAILMRSYGLRRLVALGGDRADSARAVLQRDWVDAEPEFRRSVAEVVLGSGGR